MFRDGMLEQKKMKVPSRCSQLSFEPIFRGYMAVRTANFIESADQVGSMIYSDSYELIKSVETATSVDNSLPARKVSAYLLITGTSVKSGLARAYVDAFGHLAASPLSTEHSEPVASHLRMTVLAGDDAQYVLGKLRGEMTDPDKASACSLLPNILLMLRWAKPNAKGSEEACAITMPDRLRCEVIDLQEKEIAPRVSANITDSCMERIATTLLDGASRFALHIPHQVAACRVDIANGAFVDSICAAADAFFVECNAPSKKIYDDYVRQNFDNEYFSHTSIWVRLVPKELPVDSDRGFHGFLVCRAAAVQSVVAYVRASANTLPLPPHVEWAVYLCTGWMERVELGAKVSLYALSGRCGESIASPNTAIYRTTPLLLPLGGDLLEHYDVRPCTKESTLPADQHLIKPFRAYIGPVLDLFNDMRSAINPSQSAREQRNVLPPLWKAGEAMFDEENSADKATEAYILKSFGIDNASKRVTVGDAYSRLLACNAPAVMTDMLFQATVRLGINASMHDAFAEAATVMQQVAQRTNFLDADFQRRENERVKRLAEATFGEASKRIRESPPPERSVAEEKMNGVIKLLGLKTGKRMRLQEKLKSPLTEEQVDKLVAVLSQAFRTEKEAVADGADAHAKDFVSNEVFYLQTGKSVKHLVPLVMNTSKILINSCAARDVECFYVFRYHSAPDQISIQTADGEDTTIGALVDAKQPALLLITFLDANPGPELDSMTELTATVPAGAER